MRVDPKHGRCRTCGGTLEIVEIDDCSMSVECQARGCGDSYEVEPDAFGDGCMLYYFALQAERIEAGDDA
jgi:hypothetical protein